MSFLQEFKTFAMRGSVVDMAVGVVIGAGFGKIVTAMVNDILMPITGILSGGVKFNNLNMIIRPSFMLPNGIIIPEVRMNYGNFIQASFDFLIMAFCVFLFLQFINHLRRTDIQEAQQSPPISREEALLCEIRDLLKSRTSQTGN